LSRNGSLSLSAVVIVNGSLGRVNLSSVGGDSVCGERGVGLGAVIIGVIVDRSLGGNGICREWGIGFGTVVIVIISLSSKSSAGLLGLRSGGVHVVRGARDSVDGFGLGLEGGSRGSSLNGGNRASGRGSSGCGSEKAGDTGPGGLLLVVIGVEKSLAVTLEDTGDPAVLVGDTPDGNTNTALGVETSADNIGILITLSLELSGGSGDGLMADVKLGDGDLNVEISEALESGSELRARRSLADDQMALETNTIDGGALLLEKLDKLDSLVSLGTVLLKVVVVVVPKWSDPFISRGEGGLQLGSGIGLAGSLEGDAQEVSSQSAGEDAVSPLGAVIDGLVDHIPSVTITLVVLNNVGDVSLDDLSELLSRESTIRNYMH
jgi:hypothetical protein